jgi:hypothetical protein
MICDTVDHINSEDHDRLKFSHLVRTVIPAPVLCLSDHKYIVSTYVMYSWMPCVRYKMFSWYFPAFFVYIHVNVIFCDFGTCTLCHVAPQRKNTLVAFSLGHTTHADTVQSTWVHRAAKVCEGEHHSPVFYSTYFSNSRLDASMSVSFKFLHRPYKND